MACQMVLQPWTALLYVLIVMTTAEHKSLKKFDDDDVELMVGEETMMPAAELSSSQPGHISIRCVVDCRIMRYATPNKTFSLNWPIVFQTVEPQTQQQHYMVSLMLGPWDLKSARSSQQSQNDFGVRKSSYSL